MSISLSIEELEITAQTLDTLSDDLNDAGARCKDAAFGASIVWSALSYQELIFGVSTSLAPMCSSLTILMKQIASNLRVAKQKACDTRAIANCFGCSLPGGGIESSSAEILYCDDDSVAVVLEDLANVRNGFENIIKKCGEIDATLNELKTSFVRRTTNQFQGVVDQSESALVCFEGKQETFNAGIDELLEACSDIRQYVDPFINPGDPNSVCTDFSLPNPAALNWYMAVPFQKQTDDAKALIKSLKFKGYSFTRVGVVNIENKELETVLTASGIVISAHELALSSTITLSRFLDRDFPISPKLKTAVDVLKGIGFGISFIEAWNAKEEYMYLHTELPFNTRETNAATEFDIRLIGSTIAIIPPLGDFWDSFMYGEPLEDSDLNLTRAESIYRFRYEDLGGKYGF